MQNEDRKMQGPRVYLRLLQNGDIDARYLSWFQDQELVKFYSGSKRQFTAASVQEDIEAGLRTGSHRLYGIFLNENDLCIGNVKVGPIVQEQKISDLIVIIGDRDYHGKGLAVEAISLGNQVAFEWLDIRKLYGGMYESNVASIKAYTKAGWIVEGRLRGHYWVDEKPMDRILVGCFNPQYFSSEEIKALQEKSGTFL